MKKFRYQIAVIPASVFWVVSMVFFVLGLSFNDRTGFIFYIAIALSISNTVIQIIGNDAEVDEIGYIIFAGWMFSYVLGIGSNVVSLLNILHLETISVNLEWVVTIALGAMIEITPERFFVLFWRSTFPHGISFDNIFKGQRRDYRHSPTPGHRPNPQSPAARSARPKGMPRHEWQAHLRGISQRVASVVDKENDNDESLDEMVARYQN